MTEGFLAAFLAADEGHQDAIVHPLVHLGDVDTTSADLCMDIQIHEQW